MAVRWYATNKKFSSAIWHELKATWQQSENDIQLQCIHRDIFKWYYFMFKKYPHLFMALD